MTALTPEREAEIRLRVQRFENRDMPETSCSTEGAPRDRRDLLAALDATRAELAEVRAERDAHARDLALLAEVRGHAKLSTVVDAVERERIGLASIVAAGPAAKWCSLGDENERVHVLALLVRLLRGEG